MNKTAIDLASKKASWKQVNDIYKKYSRGQDMGELSMREITGLLWNHSYAMVASMEARGVSFPRFEGSELSDLIAYLYFRGYLGEQGDPKRGSAVFEAKGCAGCHKTAVGGAPDLSTLLKRTDRADLASAMWNHAPQMHRLMAEKGPFWPKFEPGEMRNLVAYLRSLVRPAAGTRNDP